MKSTGVFQDLKFKISEGYLQARLKFSCLCCRDRKTSILVLTF
jgi:hypothetical protein